MKEQNPSVNRLYTATPDSTIGCTPHCRWSLLSMLVFRVFLLGCSSLPGEVVGSMTPSPLEFTFDQYEVVTGVAKHQTVLTGLFLGDTVAELAVVNIDDNGDRRTHIYAFDDSTWVLCLDTTLRREVLFVDVANIKGHDRLITYEPGRLNWFDPESATEHTLVAVTSNFNPPRSGEIPHVDLTRDLNDDDRDDLVVPDVDGFRVYIQTSDGTFADAVKVGARAEMARIYGADGYRYNPWGQSGIHETDYNRDGRSDLVFWNENHFEVHHQDEYGLFAPDAKTFTTDVSFDSDTITSLVAPHGVRQRRKDHQPVGDLEGRVLHSLTDQNGDGVADLVVFSLLGGSLWRMHSTYEVHFGEPTPDGTVFAPDVGTVIESDGIPFGFRQHDLDHDGQVDIMITTIKPRLLKAIGMIVGSLLTGTGSLDLEFYSMDGSVYPDKPSATRKIRSYPGDSGEKTAHLTVLIGDVNGDRRSDLLVQHSWEELRVYLGVPGQELFARRPQKIKVSMPNEEYTWLVDLNRDGKRDVFMHHPSTTEPHRVTMLIAR
ncbi:MAG: VCBS repeat-containing protein [Candidatus Poribacteria bacterium]|nr:VCBS repeat-containing protein [Candidatus Poribacteria bacterium]